MISSVRPTSRVTEERGSCTVTVSPSSPFSVELMTWPTGLEPISIGGSLGTRITA